MTNTSTQHHVVIVGGGFGGLRAALELRHAPVRVTLIDRRNFHLFQPLLYQVATGELSPANIASPLRGILRKHKNTQIFQSDVTGFDLAGKNVLTADGPVSYDTLIVAAGARHHYFGHAEWEANAPGLKTIEEATIMRRHILTAFEEAEKQKDPHHHQEWLTFVVVGGGPTGVELAGALGELSRDTLKDDFRSIKPDEAKILILETEKRILPSYPEDLSQKALGALAKLGVTCLTESLVVDVKPDAVVIKRNQKEETIKTRTVLWAAGVQASPLAKNLAEQSGLTLQRGGRLPVLPTMQLENHPEVYVLGDMAHLKNGSFDPLPAIAPVAMQQGAYVAEHLVARLQNKSIPPFNYRHHGMLAVIGRASAVADLGWMRSSGPVAWLLWLFIHLRELIKFENRLLVFMQWAWNYITRDRAARLITGDGDSL